MQVARTHLAEVLFDPHLSVFSIERPTDSDILTFVKRIAC